MKNKNEFFHEDPPAGHAEKIHAAVQDSLRRNQVSSESKNKSRRFWLLGFPVTALVALFAFRFFTQASKQESSEFIAFTDLFEGEDVAPEDLDVLAQGLDTFEILENLEMLEEMGES